MTNILETIKEQCIKGKRGAVIEEVKRALADKIGADFYGADAHGCVEKCNELLH